MPLPRSIALDLAAAPSDRILEAARAAGQSLWLVGGRLRDALLHRTGRPELDLASPDPRELLRAFRRMRGDAVVEIDAGRDTFRVVAAPGSRLEHVDLARLRAPTIEGDLRLRDFTVNALAVELGGARDTLLLDPTGGAEDLRRGVIRACGPGSVDDDPLRALRAVRLAAALGFSIEPRTLRQIARGRRGLALVSRERVRDELFQILRGPRAGAGAALALRLGLLAGVGIAWPRGAAAGRRGLPRLARVLRVVAGAPPRSPLGHALAEPLEQGVDRAGVALLGALLRDLGVAERAGAIAAACALGTRAGRGLAVACTPLPPGARSSAPHARRRALLELHHAAGDAWAEAIAAGSPDPGAARALAARHRDARRAFVRPPLLDGAAAMRELGLEPGPRLGAILAAVRRAQDLGRVRTRAGAVRLAARKAGARES